MHVNILFKLAGFYYKMAKINNHDNAEVLHKLILLQMSSLDASKQENI